MVNLACKRAKVIHVVFQVCRSDLTQCVRHINSLGRGLSAEDPLRKTSG